MCVWYASPWEWKPAWQWTCFFVLISDVLLKFDLLNVKFKMSSSMNTETLPSWILVHWCKWTSESQFGTCFIISRSETMWASPSASAILVHGGVTAETANRLPEMESKSKVWWLISYSVSCIMGLITIKHLSQQIWQQPGRCFSRKSCHCLEGAGWTHSVNAQKHKSAANDRFLKHFLLLMIGRKMLKWCCSGHVRMHQCNTVSVLTMQYFML